MQGMTPSAHRRHQMERERLERQAREHTERARLKMATAKHAMALWNVAVGGNCRALCS